VPGIALSVDAESRRQGADPLGELDEILFAKAALRPIFYSALDEVIEPQ
jgi:hypothetical protein